MVPEELFNRKLKEIEHAFRVSYSRQQRAIWYARLVSWDEERFVLGCERFLQTVEQRWEARDANLYAMLRTLTQGDAKGLALRKETENLLKESKRLAAESEPPPANIRDLIRQAVHRVKLW